MNQKELRLSRATLNDVHQFAEIKAEAYSDDRSKSKPSENLIPEWYNGGYRNRGFLGAI